jgi:hypothetical protein
MIVPGLRNLLNLTPLRLADLGVIAGSSLTSFGLNEVLKGQDNGRLATIKLHKNTSGDYSLYSANERIQSRISESFFNHRSLQGSIPTRDGAQ